MLAAVGSAAMENSQTSPAGKGASQVGPAKAPAKARNKTLPKKTIDANSLKAFWHATAKFDAACNEPDVSDLKTLVRELKVADGEVKVTPATAVAMQDLALKAVRAKGAVTAIGAAGQSLDEMAVAYKAIPSPDMKVVEALENATKTLGAMKVDRDAAMGALGKLPAGFQEYVAAGKNILDEITAAKANWPASEAGAPTDALLNQLSKNVAALAVLHDTLPELQTTLKPFQGVEWQVLAMRLGDAVLILNLLDASEHAAAGNQFSELDQRLKSRRQRLLVQAEQIASSPETQGALANALIENQTALGKVLSGLNASWTAYAGGFKGKNAGKVAKAGAGAVALQRAELEHAIAVAGIVQAFKGSYNTQVAKTLPLYYNRDVQRLMYLLRPDATVKEFGTLKDLTDSRIAISDNSFTLEDSVANLGQAQFRQRQLAIEGAAASDAVSKADSAVERKSREIERSKVHIAQLTGRNNLRQTELEQATANLTTAQQAQTANQDPEKAADLAKAVAEAIQKKQAAERAKTEAANAIALANQKQSNLDAELGVLQEKQTAAAEKQTEIEGSKKTAQDEIEKFAQEASATRKSGSKTVIQESADFAFNRDNQPLTVATGNAGDPDPVKRVSLAGFRDASTIFIRGRIDDVARVENIIAGYDRPAPQAKLTLWMMQMDIVGKPRNINAADQQIQRVGQKLMTLRNATEQLGSLLRQRVNQRVNQAASASRFLNRNFNTFDRSLGKENGDRLARFHFYDPLILTGLGFTSHGDIAANLERGRFMLRHVPDPGATTTLGETLLVLCMASRTERQAIVELFMSDAGPFLETWFRNRPELFSSTFVESAPSDVQPLIKSLGTKLSLRQSLTRPEQIDLAKTVFARTLRALWVDDRGEKDLQGKTIPADGLAPLQTEILGALQRNIVWTIAHEMHAKQLLIDDPKTDLNLRAGFVNQLKVRYDFLGKAFNLDVPALMPIFQSPTQFERFSLQYPLSGVNARIAAADDRLKKVIGAIEDDVDAAVIEPGVYEIRRELSKAALNVGILQRTSMLSTNRMVSRVDAGATAQLAASEKVDILTATQQLTALAIQSGSKNAVGILNSLKSDQNEPPQELYGVTSGGEFRVTPVFDPSGQALRFTFDYVLANRVRDPNGTTSPQLPRVERHTVNLEAQLSTFELREFSRFQANTQLGSPVHRWGGVPLLNEIPLLKEIPLIGYFVRKGGRAAVIQENVILGQTTIYPTILDMVKLLTPISSEARLGGG